MSDNKALTLEQLREMDGEPVWVEEVEHWALIDIEKSGQWAGIPFAVWAENGANFTYNIEGRELHCFHRPPEGGCEIKDYAETCEECRFCDTTLASPPEGEERHMTNADKIRAMSDEELAKLMANSCPCVYPDCNGYRDYSDDSCIKHLLEWLRQPAEED